MCQSFFAQLNPTKFDLYEVLTSFDKEVGLVHGFSNVVLLTFWLNTSLLSQCYGLDTR